MSSCVEFAAKLVPKGFALSAEDAITSGPFMRVGIDVLPLLKTLLVILQN